MNKINKNPKNISTQKIKNDRIPEKRECFFTVPILSNSLPIFIDKFTFFFRFCANLIKQELRATKSIISLFEFLFFSKFKNKSIIFIF